MFLFETFNCVSFGTLSAIETLMFRLFGEKVNYSDRWIGIMAGTNAGTNGNDLGHDLRGDKTLRFDTRRNVAIVRRGQHR